MSSAGPGLRDVRAVLRRRGERIEAGEVAYRAYLVIMLAIIVGAPVVRAVVLRLAEAPPTWATGPWPAAALTAGAALLVLAGARTGPVRASLPQLDLLLVAPLSRARLLSAGALRWLSAGTAVGAVVGGVFAAAGLLRGDTGAAQGAALVLGGACVGLLLASVPLIGQIGIRARFAAAALLGTAAAAQGVVALLGESDAEDSGATPSAPGWSAMADPAAPLSAAGALILSALAVALLVRAVAGRLRWEVMREQSALWDTVRVLAVSGDPGAALSRLGAPVRVGRRLRLRVGSRLTVSLVLRDLLGLVRAPGRSLAGCAGVLAAGAFWGAGLATAPASGPVAAALCGATALLVAYLALAPWCRGMATACAAAGSPPLLPVSGWALISRHLVVPGALACAAFGGVASVVSALSGGATGWVLLSVPLAIAIALLLRVVAALKGPIPMKLLAPVPTPAGDLAGVNVFLWTFDGPVSALLAGAALGALWWFGIATTPVPALLVSALLVAALFAWAAARLER